MCKKNNNIKRATKCSSTYFRHIIKVYTSDMHDMDSGNDTVVIRKMRSAGLYSTAWYGLYFEQYIDGYIIDFHTNFSFVSEILKLS